MNSPKVTSRWTQGDEARLVELAERKARIIEENKKPVRDVVAALQIETGCFESDRDEEESICYLIANADAFRDALEPFDSRERL